MSSTRSPPDGTLTSLNPAFEAVTGWSCAEWLGKNFVPIIHPDDRPLAVDLVQRLLRGEEIPPTTELRVATKSGEYITEEFASTLQMQKGRVLGVLGIARDITERKQAEEELRKLSRAVEQSPSLVMITDTDRNIEYVNPKFTEVTGYASEEVIGKNPRFLKSGETPPEEYERLWETITSGHEWRGEFHNRRKNGELYWASASVSPIRNREGAITHFLDVHEDITAHKRAEEELQASDKRYRELIENANDIIYSHDLEGRFTSMNGACARIIGYTPEEALTKNITQVIAPEHLERAQEMIRRKIEEGGQTTYELEIIAKDGHRVPLEVSTRIIRRGGKPVGVQGIARDISERRRAEGELQESEQRFRDLYENAPNAYFSVGMDGRMRRCNRRAEELLGYSAEELVGQPVIDLYTDTPQGKEKALKLLQRFQAGQPIRNEELLIQTADGTPVWISLTVNAITDARGEIVESRSVLVDITERKQAEEARRRLNEELEKEQQEIEALNHSLERRVKERTQKLRLANQEMQARNRQLLDARAQAATDGLTGLCNHRTFQEKVRELVARTQADGGSVGLIMLDIDGFKGINDSLGHQAGDEILLLLAQALTDVVRWEDAYRYGGDEFAVLLPGSDGPKAARIAERLRRAVAKLTGGNGTKVTVSLGIAAFPHTADSAEQLIYGADAAMYWAKSAGKNRVGDWAKLLKHEADGTLPWYADDRGVRVPDVVAALVAALAAKDPVTAAHTVRCSWYTAKLAEELGLGKEQTSVIRLASLLHDIGKLAVPDEVLFKPGPLNEDEWAQMKQHPAAALHVLDQIHSIADATPAILHHHEHFDGSGYPDGLAGEDIPLASRILLVTDAFDAMTTDRPYRKAMPVEAAIEELERNSGGQFDPKIVEAFLRILARDGAQPLRSVRSAARQTATAVRTG